MLGLGRWRNAAPPTPTAATHEERSSSTLPTIKCSDCGIEIEISRLADHLCVQTTEEPETYEPSPPPPHARPAVPRSETMDSFVASNRKSYGLLRPGRQAPPKIDPAAANKPYSRPMAPITPVSDYSGSRSVSPMISGSGRKTPMRSVTSPMPRPYSPPSPELNSNLDCAFPPWPTMGSRSNTPTGVRPRDRKPTDPGTRLAQPQSNAMYAPVSPRFDGGANVLKRMDNISPGPFDGRKGSFDRRPSATTTDNTRVDSPQAGPDEHNSPAKSIRSRSHSTGSNNSRRSRSSVRSTGLPNGPKAGFNLPPPPPPPPADDDDDDDHPFEGIDKFLRRVRDEEPLDVPKPLNTIDRSKTFPVPAQEDRAASLPRRPSEPAARSRALSNATISSVYSSDSIEAPPVPPMPSLNNLYSLATSKPGAPVTKLAPASQIPTPNSPAESSMHTSSESVSSGGSMSGFDARSVSSVSSIHESESGGPEKISRARKESDPTRGQLQSPTSYGSPPKRLPLGVQPGVVRTNAPDNISLPNPPAIPATVEELPESPMDPAIHRGIISQQRPSVSNGSGRPVNPATYPIPPALSPPEEVPARPSPLVPNSAPQNPQSFHPQPPAALQPRGALPPRLDSRNAAQLPKRQPPNVTLPLPPQNEGLQRKPTSGKRPKCRGCNESIVGKSVKAADGRLTGRWHKECFTCKTCRQPFQTADFYVHNNAPYCEHHYHQMNNSLCQLCNRGIEGQFLETDKKRKYHPRCFMCSHCRIPLKDDYLEFNGRPYCERHAQHAASQTSMLGTGARRFPERRTTKLMMMM